MFIRYPGPVIISVSVTRIVMPALLLAGIVSGVQPVLGAPIAVNTPADVIADDGQCSLREAVIAANTDTAFGASQGECGAGAGADTIILPAGTYLLTIPGPFEDLGSTGDLDVTDTLDISGAGRASTIIDGGGIDRVIQVINIGTVFGLTGATVRNGDAGGDSGGGIYLLDGTADLSNCDITANDAASGGGLFGSSGDWTLMNVNVTGNVAFGGASGGGIWNSSGNWTLTNVVINSNTSDGDGEGIYNSSGNWTATNVTISGNNVTTGGSGGGIYNSSGNWTVTDTVINANTLTGGAAAIGRRPIPLLAQTR